MKNRATLSSLCSQNQSLLILWDIFQSHFSLISSWKTFEPRLSQMAAYCLFHKAEQNWSSSNNLYLLFMLSFLLWHWECFYPSCLTIFSRSFAFGSSNRLFLHDSLNNTDSLVHHFGPDGNISRVVGRFDILGLQRMRSGDFGDPLTFYYEVKMFCFVEEISELTLTLPSPSLLQ